MADTTPVPMSGPMGVVDESISPYTPIDSTRNEIRLLKLAPGGYDDPIQIRLENSCLDDKPIYDAISYVWGNEKHDDPATVNGSLVQITSNLDCALRHFRDTSHVQVLWVDAICINQEDHIEKGAQVQLMAQVYSKAHEVLIWLGPATDAIEELFKSNPALWPPFGAPIRVAVRLFPAVEDIVTRPWFTRIWVRQEFALARWPSMCCGWLRTSWDSLNDVMFRVLLSIVGVSHTIDTGRSSTTKLYGLWNIPEDEKDMFYVVCHMGDEATKYHLVLRMLVRMRSDALVGNFAVQLSTTRGLQATDPRDKIFGILGAVHFVTRQILPDYTKNIRQVYSEAVAAAIQEDLSSTYTEWSVAHKSEDLPSWVPDLDTMKEKCLQLHVLPSKIEFQDVTDRSFTYTPLAEFSSNFQSLHAGGVILGVVQAHSTTPLKLHFKWSCDRFVFKLKADFKALTMEWDFPMDVVSSPLFGKPITVGPLPEAVLDMCTEGLEPDDNVHYCKLYMQDCTERYSEQTVLFTTDTGKIGLTSPGRVQCGDIIAGLFGINLPFVLRRRGHLERYEMMDNARLGDHVLGHPDIPRDTKEADLYTKYGFRTFVID